MNYTTESIESDISFWAEIAVELIDFVPEAVYNATRKAATLGRILLASQE